MDAVSTIIYGVISGLLAAYIFELLRSKSNWFPGPSEAPEYIEPELPDEGRARNRAKLDFAMFNMTYYFFTFFFVYMALLMPPLFKTFFNKGTVFLSDARFIGEYLPQIEIGTSYVQGSFIVIALLFYIPLLLIVSYVSKPIAAILDKFRPVNIYRWRAIQGLVFAFFSACLAVLSIYIFNQTTLQNALFTFGFFVFIAFAFGSNKRR